MNRPQIWGHRGAMALAPQNTLASFLLAQDQGADGVELDVQLTKDGVLVVFHDARVDALTDGRGPVASIPWRQLKTFDAGSHFGREWAGSRIPTLNQVLEALDPRMTVNVEMKTALSEEAWWDQWIETIRGPRRLSGSRIASARTECAPLAEALAEVLAPLDPQRFVISSFDPLALEAVGSLLPRIPLGFLHSSTGIWDTPALMRTIAHQAWHPHHSLITREAVAREHSQGRKVHVWTVNDHGHAQCLAQVGVDAIITNSPGEILTAIS